MKRRNFLKAVGGIAGLSLLNFEEALSAATKIFDEETKKWYYSMNVEGVANGTYTLSYWWKTENTSWAQHQETFEVTDGMARIKIEIGRNATKDITRLCLESGHPATPLDPNNRWGVPKKGKKHSKYNSGFVEWER